MGLRPIVSDHNRWAQKDMITEEPQRPRTMREYIGIGCGWLSACFSGFFVLSIIVFAMGIIDLREGGEAAFAVIFLTVPPVLILSTISVILRGRRRAIVAWVALVPFSLCLAWAVLGSVFHR